MQKDFTETIMDLESKVIKKRMEVDLLRIVVEREIDNENEYQQQVFDTSLRYNYHLELQQR